MRSIDRNNYYCTTIRRKVMREFNSMYKSTRAVLPEYFTQSKIDLLEQQSRREYKSLLPALPYIGGRKNADTINIIMGAIILATIKPLKGEGLSVKQIGKIIYDTFYWYFYQKPQIARTLIGKIVSSKYNLNRMKAQLAQSVKGEYEDGFVATYVESDGKTFDFGYNYTVCALHKLFEKNDAAEYLRYVCLGDHIMFYSLGIGFTRTQTMANGASYCDFRFCRNGLGAKGWPPEELEEWAFSG